jgi:hypothetical protein
VADESTDNNRVLREAAREVLAPLGLSQKGRSRTWLDDRGWHAIVVEFQPSSWSKGSYLNVGATWLWFAKDHFSFDYGYRVRDHEEAERGDWAATSLSLAQSAAKRVLAIRDEATDVTAAARLLRVEAAQPWWPEFHAAVSSGLAGDDAGAQRIFAALLRHEAPHPWQRELQRRAGDFYAHLGNSHDFQIHVIGVIQRCRLALKLNPLSDEELTRSLDPAITHF